MYLLFDIGGTNTRIAFSADLKKFSRPLVMPTPQNFKTAMASYAAAVKKLTKGKPAKLAAIGAPGVFNKTKTKLFASPNLKNWVGKNLKAELEKACGCKVLLENDADLAGLGEAIAGAGKGKEIVAYLTFSTGIGGSRIVNGKIDRAVYSFEPGRQIVDISGRYMTLGRQISGSALKKRYGKSLPEINAKKTWDEILQYAALGIHNATVFWSPDIIVIGGGIGFSPKFKLAVIKKHLQKTIGNRYPELPILKKKSLKFNGLHGAMQVIQNHLDNKTKKR